MFSLVPVSKTEVLAGAPWPPELVSPANESTASTNPPTLCARYSDPEGQNGKIRFETWGGGEGDHDSAWIDVGNNETRCWTDSGPWSSGVHSWQARAMDSDGTQAASSDWGVRIPEGSGSATCTIEPFIATPPPPQTIGLTVVLSGSATCTNGVKALHFFVDGNSIGSVNAGSGSANWNTTGWGANDHVLEVRAEDNVGGVVKTRTQTYLLTPSGRPDVDNPSPDQPGSLPNPGTGSGGSSGSSGPSAINNSWQINSIVYLCQGTEIRQGSGLTYAVHTVVPVNQWPVRVIGGPRNADGYTWFDVKRDDGGSGWVRQDQANCTPTQPNVSGSGGQTSGGVSVASCPARPGIAPGEIVVVSDQTDTNYNVRSRPGLGSSVMYTVPPYTYLSIISGPVCQDGYWWYEVGWEGKSGWMAAVGFGQSATLIENGTPMPGPSTNNPPVNNQVPVPNTPSVAPSQVEVIQTDSGNIFHGWPFAPGNSSVQVLVNELRLRSGPGTDNSTYGYVANQQYYILISVDGDWGKVQTASGKEGWIFLKSGYTNYQDQRNTTATVSKEVTVVCDGQVVVVTDWDEQTQTTSQGTNCAAYVYPQEGTALDGWTTPRYAVDYVQVTVSNLHLRSGPGEQYSILGYLTNGHYYVLLETNGNWGKVRTSSGAEGWVHLLSGVNVSRATTTNLIPIEAPSCPGIGFLCGGELVVDFTLFEWFVDQFTNEVYAHPRTYPFSDPVQCSAYVYNQGLAGVRPDIWHWLSDNSDAHTFDEQARSHGLVVQTVNDPGFYISPGDIVVWSPGCDGMNAQSGHVGFVSGINSNGKISVDHSNYSGPQTEFSVLSCMSFIHEPSNEWWADKREWPMCSTFELRNPQ